MVARFCPNTSVDAYCVRTTQRLSASTMTIRWQPFEFRGEMPAMGEKLPVQCLPECLFPGSHDHAAGDRLGSGGALLLRMTASASCIGYARWNADGPVMDGSKDRKDICVGFADAVTCTGA
jgi:hypothetical protein